MDKSLREQVLERDGHECQLSKLFGIAHLSKEGCHKDLEVHHITYERAGAEDERDLITICKRCHNILTAYIRSLRTIDTVKEISHIQVAPLSKKGSRDEEVALSDCWSFSSVDAQRADGRPGGRDTSKIESNLKFEKEN